MSIYPTVHSLREPFSGITLYLNEVLSCRNPFLFFEYNKYESCGTNFFDLFVSFSKDLHIPYNLKLTGVKTKSVWGYFHGFMFNVEINVAKFQNDSRKYRNKERNNITKTVSWWQKGHETKTGNQIDFPTYFAPFFFTALDLKKKLI